MIFNLEVANPTHLGSFVKAHLPIPLGRIYASKLASLPWRVTVCLGVGGKKYLGGLPVECGHFLMGGRCLYGSVPRRNLGTTAV